MSRVDVFFLFFVVELAVLEDRRGEFVFAFNPLKIFERVDLLEFVFTVFERP